MSAHPKQTMCVHAWDIFATKNRNLKNALQPLLTLALLAVCAWPLIGSLMLDA